MNKRTRFGRRSRVKAGAAAVALAAVVGVVSGGIERTSRAEALQGRYVALGDSIAFGYSPLLEDPWIPERFVGYPEVIAQQSGLTVTNLACPGQTAQALVSRTAVDAGCFDARRAARDAGFEPLHTDYSGTQLRAALDAVRSDRPVSLISIQGGGNEISLCLDSPAKLDRCVADAVPKVAASLSQAVTQLRAAGYQGRIVLVGYHLVPGLEAQLRRVNRAVERAASNRHVAFADAAVPFERYAQQHHGDLCTAGLLIVMPDGSCDLHPSRIGQGLLAGAVLDAAYGSELDGGTP